MSSFDILCKDLEAKIQSSYEDGITMENAEKLAGEFLFAQIQVSNELKRTDLDSRMRKSGMKAVRAAIYLDSATKGEKKPTEAMLAATVDSNDLVMGEQKGFDEAEVERDNLERYYDVFGQAHVYFRQLAKGNLG